MIEELVIHVDGACSGNPGPAGIGVVIKENGQVIKEISKPIGQATNNIAEYSALVYALQEALVFQAKKITVFTDSELMYSQIKGLYKVKDEKLRFLYEQVKQLTSNFKIFDIHHVLREHNQEADKLASSALK